MIYSNEVKNVLDRLYLEATALHGSEPKTYNACIAALQRIEHLSVDAIAKEPFAWARDKMRYIQAGRYWFSYRRFPNCIIVEEVYDSYIKQIITESFRAVISLFEHLTNHGK